MTGAVLWDLDGVLVDTAPYHFAAWRATFATAGKDYTMEEFSHNFGRQNAAIFADELPGISPQEVERLSLEKEERFRTVAAGKVQLFPSVLEILRKIRRRGIKQAIVSSTPRANLEWIAGNLSIADLFDALLSKEDAERGKPDPQGYLIAAQRLRIPPSDCIVVEDAPAGVEAASRAGMRCLAVTTTRPAEDLGLASMIVDRLSDTAALRFLLGDPV